MMLLVKERPNLIPLVVEAHRIVVRNGNHFSGHDVLRAAQWSNSNVLPLAERGVVEKTVGGAPHGGAFYRMVDPLGVERALRELALL